MVFSSFITEDVAGVKEKLVQTLVKDGKEDFIQKRGLLQVGERD